MEHLWNIKSSIVSWRNNTDASQIYESNKRKLVIVGCVAIGCIATYCTYSLYISCKNRNNEYTVLSHTERMQQYKASLKSLDLDTQAKISNIKNSREIITLQYDQKEEATKILTDYALQKAKHSSDINKLNEILNNVCNKNCVSRLKTLNILSNSNNSLYNNFLAIFNLLSFGIKNKNISYANRFEDAYQQGYTFLALGVENGGGVCNNTKLLGSEKCRLESIQRMGGSEERIRISLEPKVKGGGIFTNIKSNGSCEVRIQNMSILPKDIEDLKQNEVYTKIIKPLNTSNCTCSI